MFFNVAKNVEKVLPKEETVKVKKEEFLEAEATITENVNPASKRVYIFVDNKRVGDYDSITLCANALGMSRPMVKRAIENGIVLTNGFLLKLTNK